MNVLKHQRVGNVGFIPGYSGSISLLICLFLPFSSFTSEGSPQVVAYFTVAMTTAHGKPRVFGGEEEEKNPLLTFRGAAPWLSVCGYSFAKCVLGSDGPLTQNKMDTATPSAQVGHVHSPQGQSTDGLNQEGVSCVGGGNWAQSWHGEAEPSACQDCSISDPCSGSPVFPPQMDSLQKGVSHAWAASQ